MSVSLRRLADIYFFFFLIYLPSTNGEHSKAIIMFGAKFEVCVYS